MNNIVEFLQTQIRPYFRSHDRKPMRQQWREVRDLWSRYRCVPYHYFKHRLYERSARSDFIDYMPAKLIQRFRNDRTPRSIVRMTNDKLETIRILAGTGIRCVETLFSVTVDGIVLRSDGEAVVPRSAAGGRLIFTSKSDGRNTHYFPGVFDPTRVRRGFHYRSCYP